MKDLNLLKHREQTAFAASKMLDLVFDMGDEPLPYVRAGGFPRQKLISIINYCKNLSEIYKMERVELEKRLQKSRSKAFHKYKAECHKLEKCYSPTKEFDIK